MYVQVVELCETSSENFNLSSCRINIRSEKPKLTHVQKKKIPDQRLEESKIGKEDSRSKIRRKQKEIYRKVFGLDNI